MHNTKKITILAVIIMILTLMPAALFAANANSDRLAGNTRIATALDIASAFWTSASTVVLAPADDANLVDALAAAPLAGQENAPILLTYKGSLDPTVKAKIKALGATKVYAIGAISDAVAAEVNTISGVTVETLRGANRQSTAAGVNAKLTNPEGTFIVGYNAIPDALSVASYAAKNKYAIVLANPDGSVSASSLVGSNKYIVGGPTLVADISGVTRISGVNRYATNTAVAETLSFDYDRIYVANGVSLVDALAVAPLAAKYNAFVALASSSDVAAASVVNGKLTASSKVIAVGGTGAVAESVRGQVTYASNALVVTNVNAVNPKEIKVTFNKIVDKTSAETSSCYTFESTGTSGISEVKLQDDKKSVLVRLTNALANGDSYKVSVKNVMDTGYVKLTEYQDQYKSFYDSAPPLVERAEKTSDNKIRIYFNEPVVIGSAIVKVDNTQVSILSVSNETGKYYMETVVLYGDLIKTGTHTVQVYSVSDALRVNAKTLDLSVTYFEIGADTTAPYVTSIFAKDSDTIGIVFSEQIQNLSAINLVIKKDGFQFPDSRLTGFGTDPSDFSGKTYLVNITASDSTNPLYAAEENFVSLSVTIKGYKDASQLIGSQYDGTIILTKDTVGPSVVSAGLNSADSLSRTLTILFTETIDPAIDTSNILVVKSGVYQTVSGFTQRNTNDYKKLNIVLSEPLTGGTYTVTLNHGAVKDTAGNKNAATTTTVEYNASTGSAMQPNFIVVSPGNIITINYGEKMTDSAIDLTNYRLDGALLSAGTAIGFLDSSKYSVKITLASGTIAVSGIKMLTISKNVTADSGKSVKTSEGETYSVICYNFTDDIRPELVSAKLVTTDGSYTTNQVKVTFNEGLASISGSTYDIYNDFVVKVSGVKISVSGNSAVSSGTKEMTLTLDSAININQTVTVEIARSVDVTLNVSDTAGNVVKEGTLVTATK